MTRTKERGFSVHVRLTVRESEMLEELLVYTLKQGRQATLSSVLRSALSSTHAAMKKKETKR